MGIRPLEVPHSFLRLFVSISFVLYMFYSEWFLLLYIQVN